MRILVLNWRDPKNPKAGGAEIVTMEHAKAWVEVRHQVTWFTSRFHNSPRREMVHGVEIVRYGNAYTTVYLIAPLFYFFSGRSFDVVVDEIHGIGFFTPLYVRKPIIAFIHEVASNIWDVMFPLPLNIVGKAVERILFYLYRNIRFWTDAPSTIEDLVRCGIPRANCIDIPCPIINKTREYLPKKEKNPTYIFVSRIVKMKGIEDVVKAFAFIVRSQPAASLWIVGNGEGKYLHALKKRITSYGITKNVVFWGTVSDDQKLFLMSRAHLLLHASLKEGWGLVVMEAASQGTPSVVYNVAGLRDTVKDDQTGVLVKQNSPEALAGESLELLHNPSQYKRLQKNGLSWSKSFTWKEATTQSLHLLGH